MAGETIITVVGNLTADPEIRTTGNGASVASFTIASTPRTWNRNSNQFEDGQALFMRCSAWRDMAEHCAQSLSKGMRVIAQGRLQDGSQRTVVEMQVDEIGPSLRYATAQVTRTSSASGYAGNRGGNGFTGNNGGYANNNGGFGGNAGGYQGGAGYSGGAGYQGGASAPANAAPAAAPASDPWGNADSSAASFGSFGASSSEFGGNDGEPEF